MHKWVIVDLDGTLADCSHRVPLIPDWDAFHAGCSDDPAYMHIVELVRLLQRHHNLCILTGRSSKVRSETEAWLTGYGIEWDALFMRPETDFTPDVEFKWRIAQDFFGPHILQKVWLVIDDRDKVVQMWRDRGLTCLQPRLGDY